MILSSEFWTSRILRQTQQSESHVEDLTKDAKLSVCSPKRYNKCGGKGCLAFTQKNTFFFDLVIDKTLQ